MYIPKHFAEYDLAVISQLISQNPLATIVTRLVPPTDSVSTVNDLPLNANHIPLHLVSSETAKGLMPGKVLRGHVARANPMWKDLADCDKALVIFVGVQAYISPSLYASKKVDGKVVPTWNYEAVHIHGSIRLVHEGAGLNELMHSLTDAQEREQAHPWSVNDAPADYTDRLMQAIVGIEISIDRIEAKRKLSQNQPSVNQQSIVDGLTSQANPQMQAMAVAVKVAIKG
jgi:transcriptional regulator